jgi:hypothetical protein
LFVTIGTSGGKAGPAHGGEAGIYYNLLTDGSRVYFKEGTIGSFKIAGEVAGHRRTHIHHFH